MFFFGDRKSISESEWQLLPIDASDFEKLAIRLCEYIVNGDPRIVGIFQSSKAKRE